MSLRTVGIEFEAKGEERVTRALRNAEQAVQRLTGKQVSAQQASRNLDAQRTRETQNLERLRNKYIQGYAAMDVYSKELNDLAMAHRAGIINAEQQRIEVERLNAAMANGTLAVGGMSAANQFASRSMNGTGMAMQQVGYQVGDFLVQVQSGTNAFVAFGQQATQLVGILPLMGAGFLGLSTGGLIALASGLGIAIPLVTALGAAFVRTRGDAEDASDGIQTLEDRVRSLDQSLREYALTRQALREGVTLDELIGTESLEEAEESLASLREEYERAVEAVNAAIITGGGQGFAFFSRRASEEAVEALGELIEAENRVAELRQRQGEEQFRTFSERLQQYQEEIAMQQAIAQFGEQSAEVQRLASEQSLNAELRRIEAMREAKEITDAQAIALSEQARLLNEAQAAAEALANTNMAAGIAEAGIAAATLAMELGIALSAAQAIAGVSGGVQTATGVATGSIPPWAMEDLPEAPMTDADRAWESYLDRRRTAFGREQGGTGGTGGGGGGDVFTSLIPGIEALAEAVRLANEQTQAYEQSVDILDDALQHGLITQQEYNTLLTQAQEAYGQAQTAAYDYQNAIEQISNTASSAMEDAFMSIVDGSATAADAFRNMAREILAEAFKMLVVRPIMNSLFGGGGGGFLGGLFGGVSKNEYGNAFHAGRVIPFANGGVVSSPTMFPMRGNQTGLMGEAGPEAIMPLKRGRDGKLGVQAEGGGGQSIVIHQSFNFQANGDESVKRIIAQEAPKIANLTQQQIIDQRKRGGVMKGAFG